MKDQNQGIEVMFDIMFTKDTKVLKIPTLQVNDWTESLFRNYMAYEQFFPRGKPTYFVDYVVFMDNLINTGKDVQLLCKSEVIDNWLGDDEAVALMFNKLRDSIYMMSEDFYYADIFDLPGFLLLLWIVNQALTLCYGSFEHLASYFIGDFVFLSMINPNPGNQGHFYHLAASALDFLRGDPPFLPIKTTSIKHLLGLVHSTFHPSLLGTQSKIARREENFPISRNLMVSTTKLEDGGICFLGVPIQNMQNQEQGKENMFDITFDNDTDELHIPILKVGDSTEP
ncbi:hypothetical protein Godav_001444, partial [Gossypium davidsonii]|nr:hypothetical protein [Gossypium davidsonii]